MATETLAEVLKWRGGLPGTNGYGDNRLAAALLRSTSGDEIEHTAMLRAIMDRRASWLDYVTLTQRQWQRDSRRKSHANHHDSVMTREQYVRCGLTPPACYMGVRGVDGKSAADIRAMQARYAARLSNR